MASVRLESKVSATARRSRGPFVMTVPGGAAGKTGGVVVVGVGAVVVVLDATERSTIGVARDDGPEFCPSPIQAPRPATTTAAATAAATRRRRRRRRRAREGAVVDRELSARTVVPLRADGSVSCPRACHSSGSGPRRRTTNREIPGHRGTPGLAGG